MFSTILKLKYVQLPKIGINHIFAQLSESQRELKRLQSHHSFKSFVVTHKKNYANFEEYQKRFGIFKENMKKIQFLRETERGSAQYGPTQFSDLTEEEFKERHLGFYPPKYDPVMNIFESYLEEAEIPEDVELPDAFDWRTHGAVTPVKNQGSRFFSLNYIIYL